MVAEVHRPAPLSPAAGGAEVLAALAALPGGHELLELGRERGDIALVGGSVRDLLLGRSPRELDVVVGEPPAALAEELAGRLRASAPDAPGAPSETLHERFGTAIVQLGAVRVDIAMRRTESYPAPGALPEVRPGTVAEDLLRRDFTVNAIALPLGGPRRGELQGAENALEDLRARRLRVLHERSFIDDPTRLMRLARYRARLGFTVEAHTAELACAAVAGGATASVSRPRLGTELRLTLAEPDAIAALDALAELGVLAALHPRLVLDRELALRALALLPPDGRPPALLLSALLLAPAGDEGPDAGAQARLEMLALLDSLEFTAPERDGAVRAALEAPHMRAAIERAERPSELQRALAREAPEAIALAGALDQPGDGGRAQARAAEWLSRLRHVRLAIGGDDLLAAGVPAGPQIGQRLAAALALRLDGELAEGREAELRAALGDLP
jgi:tRNA nucleotidyltransferase (CCA-adding enzyme)